MSRSITRDRETSAGDRLARLLDSPQLAQVVPRLSPEALHQLVRHRGLEACGDMLALATPAQLKSLLDIDLWRYERPGRDAQFDVDRFGEWLEVLVDAGASVAARTVAALDPVVVVAGLSQYLRVLDPGIFEPTAQSDEEAVDRHAAMREGDSLHGDDSLECEIGGFIVRARRTDAWDAIVTLLATLDTEHGDCFLRLMQGCRRLSNSAPEVDGLDDLLQAPEQHLHDAAIDRERRRSQQGYATPADARAFLQMARTPRQSSAGALAHHPIVAAYFRAADEAEGVPDDVAGPAKRVDESVEAFTELMAEAGVMPKRPRALLDAADRDPRGDRLGHLRRLLTYIQDGHEDAYFARGRELAFLANALVAGCSLQSRAFTPHEASDAAASICNLGLGYWPARWPGATSGDTAVPESLLVDHDLVTAFEVGWSVLHTDVSLVVANGLIAILDNVDAVDGDVRRELAALRRTLLRERDAGTPWRARGAAEILAMLDTTAWAGVLGLLDECPVLPGAVTAVVERRTTPVSATDFAFISTSAQIDDVRAFMRKLPELLR